MGQGSVIVIGAGLAGLAAGCYAQMNGYQTRLFEHGARPGGVAATWKRKGFTIDGGVHFYMGHRPGSSGHDLYRQLGLAQACRFQEMTLYARFLDPQAGRVVDVTSDLNRLAKDLKALSPADAGLVDYFIAGAKAFKGLDWAANLAQPPGLSGWQDRVRMMWSLRRVLRHFSGRSNLPVNKAFQGLDDPWLRQVLENLFLPEVPVWFDMLLLGSLADGQMSLGLDGSAGLAGALEKRLEDLGGRITCRATVEKILVEGDRAVGVRLSSGQEHRAGAVISAADGHSTIFKMLGGRYVDRTIRQRYAQWPLFRPIVLINYGVDREFPAEPWFLLVKLAGKLSAGWISSDWLGVRLFNYSSAFAPAGKTVVQVMVETQWQPWLQARENMEFYQAQKERLAAEVLAHLARLWPGMAGQVEMVDVATPYTTWRYTLNRQGAYEGFLPTPELLRTRVGRTLPGLKNLFLAGQWVVPGGGVIACLSSGRQAAMLLCNQDGQPFRTCA